MSPSASVLHRSDALVPVHPAGQCPVRIQVLGHFQAEGDHGSATPSAPKVRQVLALLAVNVHQVVPVSAIFRELWSEEAPRTALRTVQTYLGQLRKLLADATGLPAAVVAKDLLVTEGRGYMLRGGAVALDTREFERLVNRARSAAAAQDHAKAAMLFTSALALWRGPALANVQAGPLLHTHIGWLEESRLSVVEQWIAAKLALQQHQDVLGDLTALAVQHPLNEGLHAQLMTVLHRCGRRASALEVYRQLRARLIEHVGLEPASQVRALQQVILAGDHVPDSVTAFGGPASRRPADRGQRGLARPA
ncbi:BTAD domain-containing putative transcriptional regulator [Kitasatospora purpeofusca]|uniref:AfsR/SARP family transcriptional regulator n=1 Tax=Kitasatospora purpeofusca TaxID=67352 RepID=UPI0036D27626